MSVTRKAYTEKEEKSAFFILKTYYSCKEQLGVLQQIGWNGGKGNRVSAFGGEAKFVLLVDMIQEMNLQNQGSQLVELLAHLECLGKDAKARRNCLHRVLEGKNRVQGTQTHTYIYTLIYTHTPLIYTLIHTYIHTLTYTHNKHLYTLSRRILLEVSRRLLLFCGMDNRRVLHWHGSSIEQRTSVAIIWENKKETYKFL